MGRKSTVGQLNFGDTFRLSPLDDEITVAWTDLDDDGVHTYVKDNQGGLHRLRTRRGCTIISR